MATKKDKYRKLSANDLRKVKINRQNCAKMAEFQSELTDKQQKDFVKESTLDDLHKKGIVIKADFSGAEVGEIVYVKLYADSLSCDVCVKNPDMHTLKTNGIGRWNYFNDHSGMNKRRSYETFYPDKQVSNVLIGEIVAGESKNSVVLGITSIAQRVENLCVVMANVDSELAYKVKGSAVEVMESYVLGVLKKNKLIARDREYLLKIFTDVKNATPIEMAEKFRILKKEMQKKLGQTKMEKTWEC